MRSKINLPIKLKHNDEYRVLVVQISSEQVIEFCLALVLLKNSLVDTLTVFDQKHSLKLNISESLDVSKEVRGRYDWVADTINIAVSSTELEMWAYFFLKYYRDGISDVDHIDIDIQSIQHGEKGIYLTLKLIDCNIAPPISEGELRMQLGLNTSSSNQ